MVGYSQVRLEVPGKPHTDTAEEEGDEVPRPQLGNLKGVVQSRDGKAQDKYDGGGQRWVVFVMIVGHLVESVCCAVLML
jgi:hypothetical protein